MSFRQDLSQMSDEEVFAAAARVTNLTDDAQMILAEASRRQNATQERIISSVGPGSDGAMGKQLEKRYRDAYRVARATIMAAGFVKSIGFALAAVGAVAAFLIAHESAPAAVAAGVIGVSTGILIFGVGILISAQGQQLLTSVDDVINSSPFLADVERAKIMRIDIGGFE